ncbi:MAG: phage holin family protein [Sphaerobacteraceae bacterium]|nr:MAG: phage holin family protein [Sphaerobacteraceae bacterium]
MHLARRIVVIWAIDALALWMLAPVVTGLELSSWVWAIWAIAVIGLLNALVRPFLLVVTLPFTVLTLGLFSLVLNAIIVLLADLVLPGLQVADLISAIWTVLGIALINTIVTGLLSINDDESFYRNVILSFARRTVPEERTDQPGLIIVEIDGLSERALNMALERGYMPTLANWLGSERFQMTPWECGLPSQTSSSQAGILYGRNENIPAFRWYEKKDQRWMISNRPWAAAEIHDRLSDGTGLLVNDGSSLTNLVSGDAPHSAMTMSSLLDRPGAMRQRSYGYYLLFLNPYSFSRTLVLMVWEAIREIGQYWRERLRRSPFPHTRGGIFPISRAVTNVFLRELNLYLLIEDMLSGTPIVYSTFLGYDVVAHHAGPLHTDSLRTLQHFDEGLAALDRAARRAPRPYQFVLLSDHGQSSGATFSQRYGFNLETLVDRALDGQEQVVGPPAEDESWAHLNALLSQAIQVESVAGRTARRVFRRRTTEGYVEFGPPRTPVEHPTSEVVVCTSGNLGLVYFTDTPGRLSLEELTVRFPRLISTLVGHPGIGFVLVRSSLYGPVVIGRQGINYLETSQVDGVDPLASFGEDAGDQLRRLDEFSNIGDLLINSTYFPQADEVAAFEDLVGSHGGLGGDQTSAFIIHPSHWSPPEKPIRNSAGIYHLIQGWLRNQEEEPIPPPPLIAEGDSGTAVPEPVHR